MPTAEDNFFQKKYTTSVAYLVGVLLFFLPFVEIKCNDMPFAQITGMGLAFGKDYKVTSGIKSLEGPDGEKAEAKTTREEGKMYMLALAALLSGVVGLALSLSDHPDRFKATILIGVLAVVSLIILMIQINNDVKTEIKNPDKLSDFSPALKVSVNYTFWFYLSACSFLAAAFFSYKHRQLQRAKPATVRQSLEGSREEKEFLKEPTDHSV